MRIIATFSLVIAMLVLSAGCGGSTGVFWSPDGTKGFYTGGHVIIGADGTILRGPDNKSPGFCWSGDSKSLYFCDEKPSGLTPSIPNRKWIQGDPPAPGPNPTEPRQTTLFAWRDGKANPIFTLDRYFIDDIAASADGHWIVVTAVSTNQPRTSPADDELFAYDLRSKTLYEVGMHGTSPSFTGENRIAFIGWFGLAGTGTVEEVVLDENADRLSFDIRANILPAGTSTPRAAGDSLVFVTAAATYPSPPDAMPGSQITRVSRTGNITNLGTTNFASVSPDGKQIMFIDQPDAGTNNLSLMNADGTHKRVLMDLKPFNSAVLPMQPAWHGDDRVTFVSTEGQQVPATDKTQTQRKYDVVDYQIPPDGPMTPTVTLSAKWPIELKPATTEPQPVVQPVGQKTP